MRQNWSPRELVLALVRVKRAAALVNRELGALDADKARAIVLACDEVLAGDGEAPVRPLLADPP